MIKLRVSGCTTIGDSRIITLKSGKNGVFIADYIVAEIHNITLNSLRQKIEKILDDFKEKKDYLVLGKEDIKENKIKLRSCGFSNISLDRSSKIYLIGVNVYCALLETINNNTVEKYASDILDLVFGIESEEETEVVEKVELPCKMQVEGEVLIGDKKISVVKGGFGTSQRILSELQIAELHNKELKHIRDAVKRIESKLIQWVDYIDLNSCLDVGSYLDMLGYTKQQRTAKHFYIFSERGYLKLAKHFNNDESWELFANMLDDYFNKEIERPKENDNADRANALLMAIEGKTVADRTIGLQKYTELLTSDMQQTIDAQNLLIDTIVSDDSIYAVSLVGRVLKSYNPKVFGKVKIFEMMRASGILISSRKKDEHNTPHYSYSKYFEVKLREITLDDGDRKVVPKTYFNAKGLEWFLKRVSKEGLIDKSKIKEIKDIIVNVDKTSLAA